MVPASLIDLVPELGQANVRMKDPLLVEKSIRIMMKDGPHKLQVIADFDRTLSKYQENGKACSTTHGVLEESDCMPEDFKREATKLKDKYLPIEFDHSTTVEEKIPKMIEWYEGKETHNGWSKGHALLASCGLTKDKLSHVVAKSNARLRNGCGQLFDTLHKLDIPLLLFSAGIGDVIVETVQQQATFYDNMKLVSNFIHFDETGKMVGFTGNDVIHTFNKNESSILNSDYFNRIKHCENVLLMGDSVGDVHMAHGAQNVECMLKVGFLNFKVEENMSTYLDNFDIIIIEDESVDVVNGMVRVIAGLSPVS